jgi:hypothetical protein
LCLVTRMAVLLTHNLFDILLPMTQEDLQVSDPQAEAFHEVRQKYLEEAQTPDLLTDTWQGFWDCFNPEGQEVPRCPLSAEQLHELRRQGRELVYVPPAVDLGRLANMFPDTFDSSTLTAGAIIRDTHDDSGWFGVESTLSWNGDDRNTDMTGPALDASFREQDVRGMGFRTYVVASVAARKLWGGSSPLDVDSISRLPGAVMEINSPDGESTTAPISVKTTRGGMIQVLTIFPETHGPAIGGRSERVF